MSREPRSDRAAALGLAHDSSGLVQDSGFRRVLDGNAVEGPYRRQRQRRVRGVRAVWRALLAWLAAPSPWGRQ